MSWFKHGRFIRILSNVIAVLGCLLFLCSVILPFWYAEFGSGDLYMYTNHARYSSFYFTIDGTEIHSFWDYWRRMYYEMDSINLLLPLLFLVQVLTLITGTVSIFSKKKLLLTIASVILCSVAIALMTDISFNLREWWYYWDWHYLEGYWLAFPSLLMFLLAFITSLVARKRKTTNTREPQQ